MRNLSAGGAAWCLLILAATVGCSQEIEAGAASSTTLLASPLVAPGTAAPPVPSASATTPSEAVPPPGSARGPQQLSSVLFSEHDAEIGTRISGVVASIAVELGDAVSAGQLLAVLRDESEQVAVEAAQAALDLARLEFERSSRLGEQNLITQAEIERTAYRLRAAEAALREARVRLEHTRIRAPFAGSVTRRSVRVGQLVQEHDPVVRVTALQPLRVLVSVPEMASLALAPGQPVALRSLSGASIEGRIARIAPAVDPVSGTVEVLVSIANPGGLRPGSTVTVEMSSAVGPKP